MKLILEQRYLFDGSAGTIGHHAAIHSDHPDLLQNHSDLAAIAASEMPGAASQPATNASLTTMLIVDPGVANWQSLVAGTKPGVQVVVLDPAMDGVSQVTHALRGLTGVKNLEFLTDGTPGAVSLGGSTLDLATLTARAAEITSWSASLSPHADVAFWGCDVGKGGAGAAFIADMHTLTGATIAASSDATGSVTLGGNWNLEATTGDLHSGLVPFSVAAEAGYKGVLDIPLPAVTLTTTDATSAHVAPNTILLGDTVNVSLSFSNQALNATGFGPYVEFFAPTALTLSNVSSAGTRLAPRSALVVGGDYANPLTGRTETAPAGITSGTAYFLALPYGSFTPGEPAVGITAQLDFNTASTPAELTALVGIPLPIEARAGFEFGAVATGGTPILAATPSAIALTPELIESWITVTTMPGEGETATGPDFPVSYVVHLEPAPAVASSHVPITNLGFNFVLPNDVIAIEDAAGMPVTPVSTGGGIAAIVNTAANGGTEQTVTVDYASLSATQTVSFSAYVPEFFQSGSTAGQPILDPSTGAPVAIGVTPAYTFAADTWNGLAVGGDGDISAATFSAKSLAVQLVADLSSQLPTQDVHYTLKFEVSDYFGISGLGLGATLGNGLEFDPGTTPTLTVTAGSHGGVSTGPAFFAITPATEQSATINTETVATAGSGADIAYLYDAGIGQTAVTFDIGGKLPGTYGAGTVGSVGFSATVLDKYPVGTDQVPGAGDFLRESDAASTNGLGTAAALFDFAGGTYSPSVGPIADATTTATDTLPKGSLSLTVVAIDNVPYLPGDALPTIKPGDLVVYQLVYTLAAPGDFAGLSVAAYVPEPVFSVLNPAAPNTSDYTTSANATFTASAATAEQLTTGSYNFSTSYGGTPGIEITSATASEPSNSVTFVIAATGNPYLNLSTGAGSAQIVTIDFAVTASSLPFVDGLHLTAQGDSTYTPAQAPAFAFQQPQMLFLGEPLLTNIKQGIVSVVGDNGSDLATAPNIAWTVGDTGAVTEAAAASAVFTTAGSASVFSSPAAPATLNPAAENLNLTGAQAGDTVRIVDTVQNTGAYNAYDVILKDALSQAFTTGDVARLTFTRGDGTTLVAIDPTTGSTFANIAAETSAFFSTGVLLTVNADHTAPVLSATGPSSDIVYASYDVTLPAATPAGASLTGQASVVAWTNQDLFATSGGAYTLNMPNGADGNFADASAVGSSPATLTDTATVATAAPGINDTITGAANASDGTATIPANSFSTHGATVVPGETVSLSTTVTLPQGINKDVTAIDMPPTGLNLIPGSVVATYFDQAGTPTQLPGADVTLNGATNTLSLNTANWTVPEHGGGDKPATIVLTYQAFVPPAPPVDASTWGTNAAAGDMALKDSFAATSEGLSYTATTENITTPPVTIATANQSGDALAVTVINPLITASITELGGTDDQNVYSHEPLTYQLTLTNSSTQATAYDIGSSIQLPAGLIYVPGSLVRISGPPLTITDANVGSEGVAGPGNSLSAMASLLPGATATFTFQGIVDNNLPAGTALTVEARPAWNSLPNAAGDGFTANPNAQAYIGAKGSVTNSVAVLTPTLTIIGESNNTSGEGISFDPVSAITATNSEIIRMRAVLQVPEGQNAASDIVVNLPDGLTFRNGATNVLLDGSTTVALISPAGDLVSSTTLGAAPAQASRSVFLGNLSLAATGATDPVTTPLLTGAITAGSTTATFNIGQLTDNEGSPNPNYVVVEFNAVVTANASPTAPGLPLSARMHGDTGTPPAITPTTTVSDAITVIAPFVTLTKTVDTVVYHADGSATVTYIDTVGNAGSSPAYSLTLEDPAGAASGGSNFTAALDTLGSGASQSFTYSVTIPANQIAAVALLSDSPAIVTSYALNPLLESGATPHTQTSETLIHTSLAPPPRTTTAVAGLDLVSGSVSQDISATGTDATLVALPAQTVSATLPGGVESVTTDGGGNYTLLVPDNAGPVDIKVTTVSPPAPGNGPAPSLPETLNNATELTAGLPSASTTTTDPATLTFTPAVRNSYANVGFDFHRPLDTAPILTNGLSASLLTPVGSPVAPFGGATVADTQLDGTFSHDYSGTTLTLQRYAGNTATPDGTDVFTGSGTLSLTAGNVVLNNTTIGTFTEAGGVLSISFAATGVTNTTVSGVLEQIAYTSTAGGNTTLPAIVIGAQINDANNDPIVLTGGTADPNGPHDQGPGGNLSSNVLQATVGITQVAPGLSIIGESNVTSGSAQLFDPTGQTTATAVTTTDGGIVRIRAVVRLPEGTNSAADIVVTLPTGLSFQNDGSTSVLLASSNGDAATSLTGTGLHYASGSTPLDLSRLSLGTASTDPVLTPLNDAGAISLSGQSVTFALGDITNPATAPGANYAVVEFNAVVARDQPATATPLAATMHADANATSTATETAYVSVVAPQVTLAKTIDHIAYNPDGSVTITYADIETNTGNSPAYSVRLIDPGAGAGIATYVGTSGDGTVTQAAGTGSTFDAVVSVLPPGGSQTFTVAVTIPDSQAASAVSDAAALALITSNALNPAQETGGQETLATTSLTPPAYAATATAGLDLISGSVNQDGAPAPGPDNVLVPLAGQTVSVTLPGPTGTETTTTDAGGHYALLVPDVGVPVTLKVAIASPAADVLDNAAALAAAVPGGSVIGTNPVVLSFTIAPDKTYSPVDFDFWRSLDTAPGLAGAPSTEQTIGTASPALLFPRATVADAELDGQFASDFSGTTLTIQRIIGGAAAPDPTDAFSASGPVSLIGSPAGIAGSAGIGGLTGSVFVAGTPVGTYTEATGALTIKFAATGVTSTTVDAVLNAITYASDLPGNPSVPGIVIGARIDDANNDPVSLNGNATDPTGPHDQGPGGNLLSNVLTTTFNVVGAGSATTFFEPNDSTPAKAAVAVDPTIDLGNIAHTIGTPSQVTLAITDAHPEDVLTFGGTPDITGNYANGTLTLSAISGHIPTLAAWQDAVQSVQYYNASDVPSITTRDVTVTITSGGNTATELTTVAIVPVNDSPVLDTTVPVKLNDSVEYQGTSNPEPVGAVGTMISQIASLQVGTPGNVTDPDGAGLTNGQLPAPAGIAITGFSTTDAGGRAVGTWYYSGNDGTTWTAFPATISDTRPLDLSATARIAFQPLATDFNGQIPNAITFRAWDGFDGTASGSQAGLPASAASGRVGLGQSAPDNTPATAYSIATDTLPLTVGTVNNAPFAAGVAALPPVSPSDPSVPGQTIEQLFAQGFTDPRDSQKIPIANPLGSISNVLAGTAVTGNAATPDQGVWEYSVDGGRNWTPVPATVSLANAVILPIGAKLAFQPADGFSGQPGLLTVNLIDSSNTSVVPGLTGAQLASEGSGGVPLTALTGVDITAVGGSTPFSATTLNLGTLVNPLASTLRTVPADLPGRAPRGFPDDLTHEPTGLQFWTTDDYLGRPLIPDLSLVGSVADRFIIENQHAVITVPSNIFQDSLPQAQLTYEARLPDGETLPSWLTFNPNDLTFSGTPPAGSHGRLEILLRARDVAGNTVDAQFNLLIGYDQRDLAGLLQPHRHPHLFPLHHSDLVRGLRDAAAALAPAQPPPHPAADHEPTPAAFRAAAEVVHQTAAETVRRAVAETVHRVTERAALLADLPPHGLPAGGFSSALHAAGPMPALGRARALLDTIDDLVRQRPAA